MVSVATGMITTVAGNGTRGYNGDNIAATSAELNQPYSVLADAAGNVYIPDELNQRVRMVTAATGVITTVAGTGTLGYNGDNIAATAAELSDPEGLAMDGAGNLYISDNGNRRVRVVAAGTGMITTFAGNGTEGYNGDGGAATAAELYYPEGLAFDAKGRLYIVDNLGVVRVVYP
jgi:sugar lactone lactonase YvrE